VRGAMSEAHFIENDRRFKKIPNTHDEWESGFWKITESTAQALMNGDLYFHEKQTQPSYFGGTILGYRLQPDGEYAGRMIFRFRASNINKMVRTSHT